MKPFLIIAFIACSLAYDIRAQVSLGTDATPPDPSAMLDIRSTDKGILVPRMTTAQRLAISQPAEGLLVFDTTTGQFWYRTGGQWTALAAGVTDHITDADGDTRVHVEKTPDADKISFEINGEERFSMDGPVLSVLNPSRNVLIGEDTGGNLPLSHTDNTLVGYRAGAGVTSATLLTALGTMALENNTHGNHNTAVGSHALRFNTSGTNNTATGQSALAKNVNGWNNTATGGIALEQNTSGSGNTALGYGALYTNKANSMSTAIGMHAMYYADDRTEGQETYNTAVGYEAMRGSTTVAANTGRWNTAVGHNTLKFVSSGSDNTALGCQAMISTTTGTANTATGWRSLYLNTSGHYNSATGWQALFANTTGNDNSALGYRALHENTTGLGNTAVGKWALAQNTTGQYNTAIGWSAGDGGGNSTNGTFVGRGAYPSAAGLSNVTAIGYNARPTASNQVRIGNASVTSIGGYAGWTNLSDERYKRDIREDVEGLDFIRRLRPVTYTYAEDELAAYLGEDRMRADSGEFIDHVDLNDLAARTAKAGIRQSGFLAQDVETAARETGFPFSGIDAPSDEGGLYGLRYAEFVVPLVKAVQELAAAQEELQSHANAQARRIVYLEQELAEVRDRTAREGAN